MPEQAPARAVGRQRDAAEVAALHADDPVVAREALVEERVVGGQHLDRGAVLANDAVDEELGLALHAAAAASRPS